MKINENTVVISRLFNIFNTSKKENNEKTYLSELKNQLNRTKLELNAARDNFNNVTDPVLTDVFIYRIKSEEARYDRILREIKRGM